MKVSNTVPFGSFQDAYSYTKKFNIQNYSIMRGSIGHAFHQWTLVVWDGKNG